MFQQILDDLAPKIYKCNDPAFQLRIRRVCEYLYVKLHPDIIKVIREDKTRMYPIPMLSPHHPPVYIVTESILHHWEYQ